MMAMMTVTATMMKTVMMMSGRGIVGGEGWERGRMRKRQRSTDTCHYSYSLDFSEYMF